jgi:tRNA(Leu) C34 or U34 (ribose-2'-O)-methylase TrmL
MLNIVLVEPEIPNNRNIGRLCVGTESRLHSSIFRFCNQ